MDSTRRYNSGVAALCGLLGSFVLPIFAGMAGIRDDRLLSILVLVGLGGGWVLGATYAYFLFFEENGTAKPLTVKIESTILKWRQRKCAMGLHSWERFYISKTCRVCGKRQAI